jgi:hypothetical protein
MRAAGPDELVGWIVASGLLAVMIWRGLAWFLRGTPTSDPWGVVTAARLEDPEIKPLCTRCLLSARRDRLVLPQLRHGGQPHNQLDAYLNYLSLGMSSATGLQGTSRCTWTAILGYILVSSIYYGGFVLPFMWLSSLLGSLAAIPGLVFLALYWRRLAGNIQRHRDERNHRPPLIGAGTDIAPAG